jgi:hypothetical protein
LQLRRFRHLQEEDEGGAAGGEKRRAVAEMIDDLTGGKATERSPYALHRGDPPWARLQRPLPRMTLGLR